MIRHQQHQEWNMSFIKVWYYNPTGHTRNVLYLLQYFQEAQDDTMCDILSKLFNGKQTGSSLNILIGKLLIPVEVTDFKWHL